MPIPPSRASAIAIRASVTVSIAAETTGTLSAIVRVSRVAVETSFGSTADSAGTSSTSSKVSPSRPNFSDARGRCARARSSTGNLSTSIGQTIPAVVGARTATPPGAGLRQATRRPVVSSVTSTAGWSRPAWRGSKRPAPSSSVEAAPAATAARSCSSGGRPALRAARNAPSSASPVPTFETGSTPRRDDAVAARRRAPRGAARSSRSRS